MGTKSELEVYAPVTKAKDVLTDSVEVNPDNPRLIFGQMKFDELLESIRENGILVPLTVYEVSEDRYMLIDGQRRLMCAQRLNFKKVPVNIIGRPTREEYILRMFNIHNVKEDWKLMPTALKLKEIINLRKSDNVVELALITGLSKSAVVRCKKLLRLPQKYIELILEEEKKEVKKRKFSEDFFLDMLGAIDSIKRYRKPVYSKYTEEELIERLVEKRTREKIENATEFRRKVSQIARAHTKGVPHKEADSALLELIEKVDATISDAFDTPSIKYAYESVDIKKKCESLIRDLDFLTISSKDETLLSVLTDLLQVVKAKIRKLTEA